MLKILSKLLKIAQLDKLQVVFLCFVYSNAR